VPRCVALPPVEIIYVRYANCHARRTHPWDLFGFLLMHARAGAGQAMKKDQTMCDSSLRRRPGPCDFTALSCPVPSANGHRILEEKHPDIITCAGSRELGLPATGVFKDVRSAIPVSRKTYSSTGSCLLSILMQSCPVARIQTLQSYRVGAAQPCKASSTVQTLLVHQRRVMHERRRRS
jgi:hypothetical protein